MKSYDNNPPREEKEEMKNTNTNLIGITVKFPNSNKTYDYIIEEDCRNYLCAGDKIRIVNEHFYNYGTAEVEVICFDKQPTDNARLRIIAFTNEKIDIGWFDTKYINPEEHSEIEFVACFNSIIPPNNGTKNFDNYFIKAIYFRDTYRDTYGKIDSFKKEYLCSFENSSQVNKTRLDWTWTWAGMPMTDETVTNYNNDTIKGEDNMNIFSNFDFGKVTKDDYAMTLKGVAYRSIGDSSAESGCSRAYVQYNPETNDFEDVTPFILDINVKDFLFKMPVATSAIKAGDIILDRQTPAFVKEVKGSEITVVDPITREVRTILATKNIFNFNFVTKIVNLMDNFNLASSANAENPFGNILPLMMLSDSKNMKDMLPLMLLSNGGSVDFTSNPMMLYFLMKDEKSNDMLPFLLMSNNGLFSAPAKDVE